MLTFNIGPVRTAICGGIGGTALWTLIFPTDVVKSRIQIQKLDTTMIACMRNIVQQEGNELFHSLIKIS